MAEDRDRPPGPRPDRQSAEIHRPRLERARRCRRLVVRPQDDPAEHEVGERRHLDEERLGRVLEPFQAALEINSDLSQRTRWEVLH